MRERTVLAMIAAEVFGLERVPAPKFKGQEVAWLALGEQQLHLFQREGAPQFHHFALDVDDFEAAYAKVRELEIRDDRTFFGGIFELPGGLVDIDWPDASTLDRSIVTDIVRLADLVPQGPEERCARLYTGRPEYGPLRPG